MKGLMKVLIGVGVVLIILGVAGMLMASEAGYNEMAEMILDFGSSFGAMDSLSAGERFQLNLMRNRSTYLTIGCISAALGYLLGKVKTE